MGKNTAVSLTSPSKNDGQAQEKLTLRVDELLSRETSQNLQLRKWRDMETQLQVQRLGILRSIRRLKHMLKETRVLQGGAVDSEIVDGTIQIGFQGRSYVG